MKKILFLLLISLSGGLTYNTQAQNLDWQHRFNQDTRDETAYAIDQAPAPDNGYVVVGASANSSPASEVKFFIIKTLANGTRDNAFGSSGAKNGSRLISKTGYNFMYAYAVKTVADGYIIAGAIRATYTSKWEGYVFKLSLNGESLIWERIIDNAVGNELIYAIDVAPDGTIALAGATDSQGSGAYDAFLLLLNQAGQIPGGGTFASAAKTFGGQGNDLFSSVKYATFNGGGFIMAGTQGGVLGSSKEDADYLLVSTTLQGVTNFTRTFGDANNNFGGAAIQTSEPGYAIAGYTSKGPNKFDTYLVTVDNQGNNQRETLYEKDGRRTVNSITQTADGGFAMAGCNSNDNFVGQYYNYVLRVLPFDKGYAKLWEMGTGESQDLIGDSPNSKAYAIIRDRQGNYVVAGRTKASINAWGETGFANNDHFYIGRIKTECETGAALVLNTTSAMASRNNIWPVYEKINLKATYTTSNFPYPADSIRWKAEYLIEGKVAFVRTISNPENYRFEKADSVILKPVYFCVGGTEVVFNPVKTIKLDIGFKQRIDVDWPGSYEDALILCEVYVERNVPGEGPVTSYEGRTSSEGRFIVFGLKRNDRVLIRPTKYINPYAQANYTVNFDAEQSSPVIINLSPSYTDGY